MKKIKKTFQKCLTATDGVCYDYVNDKTYRSVRQKKRNKKMVRDVKFTVGMSDKEIMYVVANEWIDEICLKALKDAEELMSNKVVRELVVQAAEQKLAYEDKRKKFLFGEIETASDNFWYETAVKDWKAYKTVLYDTVFRDYGSNSHNA